MKTKLEILKERAEILKHPLYQEAETEKREAVVSFYLADEQYAIEASYVLRVIALKHYTPLPCTPDFIMGVINLESRIIAIVNLKSFFHLPDKGITNLNRLIIVSYDGIEFGILADEIIGRYEVGANDIQHAIPEIAGINAELIRGITKDKIIILNTKRLITDKRLMINEKQAGTEGGSE